MQTCCVLAIAALSLINSDAFAQGIPSQSTVSVTRPRASDLGLKVGVLPAGPLDAITDVAGVAVGHTTIIRIEDVRTGVTGDALSGQ